jgi:asparagine synthetase B (glutamine-hydrolysing)
VHARLDPLTRGLPAPRLLAPLELATAVVFGRDAEAPTLERRPGNHPLGALEAAMVPALRRAPCVVSFSGGRDSSALLAVATRLARREGLPEPIPVTLLFPQASRTHEGEWQEEVIRRLGCSDWVRLEFTDELDLVGPIARQVMSRLGLPYPYNLHLLLPLMEAGKGGSFVTGMGGDQALFAAGRALDVLARRARPAPRDVLRIAKAAAPRVVRRTALRGQVVLRFPWLSEHGNDALERSWLNEVARSPLRWNERLREMWRSRFMQLSLDRIAALARRVDVEPIHPFVDPGFISVLAATAGATGFRDRSAAMHGLFAEDLPERVVTRETKASFDEVLWNRHTHSFLAGMTPERLRPSLRMLAVEELTDHQALLEHWQQPQPLANSFLLLQACWLAEHAEIIGQ